MRSMKDDCRAALKYLGRRIRKLDKKKKWKAEDEKEYEDLYMYCNGIKAAIDTLSYYEEREEILKTRFGAAEVDACVEAWLKLKIAHGNEQLGIGVEVQEDD